MRRTLTEMTCRKTSDRSTRKRLRSNFVVRSITFAFVLCLGTFDYCLGEDVARQIENLERAEIDIESADGEQRRLAFDIIAKDVEHADERFPSLKHL